MSNVLKAMVAALSAALVVLHTVLLSGGAITWADWQTIVDAAIGPILVYLVPNLQPMAAVPVLSSAAAVRTDVGVTEPPSTVVR